VHIPLRGSLKTIQSMLNKVGMGSLTDDLELRLNRAAEAAVTKASKLFGNAIAQMTIEHAKAILNGPNDSAAKYFQSKMSGLLMGEMKPVVDSQLSQAGAIASYYKVIGQYKTIPFVPDVKANLTNHVLEKTIADGFLYLGREEATIRENPSKRTTDLLKKVFAADMSEACLLLPSAAADCMVLEAHLQELRAMNIEDALVQIAIEDTEALIK
jgi:hypothetical protein